MAHSHSCLSRWLHVTMFTLGALDSVSYCGWHSHSCRLLWLLFGVCSLWRHGYSVRSLWCHLYCSCCGRLLTVGCCGCFVTVISHCVCSLCLHSTVPEYCCTRTVFIHCGSSVTVSPRSHGGGRWAPTTTTVLPHSCSVSTVAAVDRVDGGCFTQCSHCGCRPQCSHCGCIHRV